MSKKNKESIKISVKGKEFIKNMQRNRIKLDLPEFTYAECLERIVDYFKENHGLYVDMVKGGNKNVR